MNWLRNFLLGGILLITFYLFIQWNTFSKRETLPTAGVPTSAQPSQTRGESEIPVFSPSETLADESAAAISSDDLPSANATDPVLIPTNNRQSRNLIQVQTDTLNVKIDPLGGDLVMVSLPQHFAKIDTPNQPFTLLDSSETRTYYATTGLVGPNGTDKPGQPKPLYASKSTDYFLDEGEDILSFDLLFENEDNAVIKRFTFTRDSYLINVSYFITNKSDASWTANLFGQIKRDDYVPEKVNSFAMASFTGYALTTQEKNYQRLKLKDITREKFTANIQNGWLAFVQHYFVSAWVPEKEKDVSYRVFKSGNLNIGDFLVNQALVIPPSETGTISAHFYAGPKDMRVMQTLAPHLDKTLDYGWLWFIGKPLFYAMDNIHSFVGNWGIAIILLTLSIKLVFFYPSAMGYRSMAKMRKITPMIQELKERCGDDRQRMASEQMKLFKKEKVNPVSGCLPILMQMPVFIALYWMIMESVELRHSPFFLWIEDLSVMDPYFVLPLIMGASMYFQQKLNPAPTDPMQAKVMQMLPIMFTFLFLFFPSGLVLYWVVNNILSITQQYVITRNIEKAS